jgi:hypothetical protein
MSEGVLQMLLRFQQLVTTLEQQFESHGTIDGAVISDASQLHGTIRSALRPGTGAAHQKLSSDFRRVENQFVALKGRASRIR